MTALIKSKQRTMHHNKPLGYHVTRYAMHATQLFIDRPGVPHAHVQCAPCMGHIRQKTCPFQIGCKIFLKGVVFMFWHDILYMELLYCVTKFELCLDMK